MSGKGSAQRPTDKQKYDEGWDRIFGKKTEDTKPEEKKTDRNKK